jgi:exodeoxyribonuclease V beta subunit
MTDNEQFDLLHSSLEGTNLLEASAGTGKTYTITGLFLRLVLEKRLPVSQILVVTFTDAATGELKDRIRNQLREAIKVFSGGEIRDPFLEKLTKKQSDAAKALGCLKEALREFDEASIFTIHGFCQRMLQENAFESGSLFDTVLITDQEALKREIVDDFWRINFYDASPLFVHYAMDHNVNPDSLLALLGNRAAQPYLKIIPQFECVDSTKVEKAYRRSFNEVRKTWVSSKKEIEQIFTTEEGLKKNLYSKEKIPAWVRGMDLFTAFGENHCRLFKGFEKFTSSVLHSAVKKNYTPPTHPFFDLCEDFKEKQIALEIVFDQRLLGLKRTLFTFVEKELEKRKREKNIQSFDDLLLKLQKALARKGGDRLAKAMGMRYKAVLIDEFQDTDPVQYAIFKKVYGGEGHTLFLIGDPKQAIYGFRGADIFTYKEASGNVKSRYTLSENWRSHPGLITAINTFFGAAKRPFVYDYIPFQPASPAGQKEPEWLTIHGESEPPFQMWFLDAGKICESGKPVTKTTARELIPRAVAGEIGRLIELGRNHRALIGNKPLKESDIAVLVRRNDEARLMQEVLASLHIPSVLSSTGNLFDTREALEMERVLAGIVEPDDQGRLKASLTTDIIGVRGETLNRLMDDECEWEDRLIKFKKYHDLWNRRGLMSMFRELLLKEKVLARLMAFPDGERRNTNLLHLLEVLHAQAIEKKMNMAGVIKWLAEKRQERSQAVEEHQLRLESDENAVKLATIHKCKGLEYPIVFCPFAWDGSRIQRSNEPFLFHDQHDNMRLTFDLGSLERDINRVSAEKERLAENMRLLYVALTRAKNRCYFVWGRINAAGTSAPAYLIYQKDSDKKEENVVKAADESFERLSDEDVYRALEVVEGKAGGAIKLSDMPVGNGLKRNLAREETATLACRVFSGTIDRRWRISSFSSLVSTYHQSADLADRDAVRETEDAADFEQTTTPDREAPTGIFAFPKGTRAGTFMHDIFENLDFTRMDSPELENLVTDKLNIHGFERTWQKTICEMVRKVSSVPLDPDVMGLRLSLVREEDRINELEFYFPLKPISTKRLGELFEPYAPDHVPEGLPERVGRMSFSTVQGFMKGFMDMVFRYQDRFYLVDWKSNLLGDRLDDYDQEGVSRAMENGGYHFQYYIYTVALNQYLKYRIPDYNYEQHFGGVYYIFVRGVDPDAGPHLGIYRDRPSEPLIGALSAYLIG